MSALLPVALAMLLGAVVLARPTVPASRPTASRPRPSLPRPGARSAAVVVALGAAVLLGGAAGAMAGVLLGALTWFGVPRLQTSADRARRLELARQAPLVVDLLAACLASGASVEASVAAASRAVPGAAGEVLATATAALRLGADPVDVWRTVGELPELAGLARAAARSAATGAPLATLLPRVADDLRATHRSAVEARTRTAAVRLTAPLGAAFLPAFVLLGVVPVVASWVGTLI
ncbi:MAG: type II secretion system F family protein [Candidatus Nanopelagicales bacterium]